MAPAPGHRRDGPYPVRPAILEDHVTLQEIFREASLANPSDRDQLLLRPDLLTFSDEAIRQGRCRVAAHRDGHVVGFHSLMVDGDVAELEDLFVTPPMWQRGVGRALILDAVSQARDRSCVRIEVTANPDALAFYEKTGFVFDHPVDTELGPGLRMHLDVR